MEGDFDNIPPNLQNLGNLNNLHTFVAGSFERLAPMVEREHQKSEVAHPLTIPAPDIERLAHPAEDQEAEMTDSGRDYLEENRRLWKTQIDFMRAMTVEMIQMRKELDDIRAKFERER